jgi:hypothetical protein
MPRSPDHDGSSKPGAPSPAAGRAKSRVTAFGLVLSLLLVSAAVAVADSGSVGKGSVTGQVKGSLKVPKIKTGPLGIPLNGCQISPKGVESDSTLLLNYSNAKLHLNGHSVKATAVESVVLVAKKGRTESLAPIQNGNDGPMYTSRVEFSVEVARKVYDWLSVSGTIRTSTNAHSGSFNAGFVADLRADGKTFSSGATKPVHVTASWSSCQEPGSQ